MKTALSTLAAALALALGNTAFAADNAPAVTHWDMWQENLVREFSQGLGVGIAEVHPVLVAGAEPAAAGRSHLHHAKAKKHSH